MKWVTSLFLALALTGCGTWDKFTIPTVSKTPIYTPCKVEDLAQPDLIFDRTATENMTQYEKATLLLAQDYNLKGYVITLEAALGGCKGKVPVLSKD